MRRREFLALPAVAGLPAVQSPRAPRPRATLRLTSARPFDEFSRLWLRHGFGDARRVTARAHPAWWPSPTELPDRWQAWIELADHSAVRVLCQPRQTPLPEAHELCSTAVRLRDELRA